VKALQGLEVSGSTTGDSLYQGVLMSVPSSLVGLPCWLFILKIIFVKVCFNISKLGLLSIKDECCTQYCCKIDLGFWVFDTTKSLICLGYTNI